MNAHELISFGAMCQKEFNMRSDFTVMIIPNNCRTYRIAHSNKIEFPTSIIYPPITSIEYEDIKLVEFYNHKKVRVGYSARANILFICGYIIGG